MDDTWICHICGQERHDSCISVLSYAGNGKYTTYNVRYCNDNIGCLEQALEWKRKGEFPK